jgi:type II secretory pathway pseudopilin PulG
MKFMKARKRSFTLVEIMTVMAIVIVLVSLAITEGVNFRKQANESNAMANLKGISTAFEVYAARHGGSYAPGDETSLQFLVDGGFLYQDFTALGQLGNYHYQAAQINPGGYDIRTMAINHNLANHNYQITSGGMLKRSDTAAPADTDFKSF